MLYQTADLEIYNSDSDKLFTFFVRVVDLWFLVRVSFAGAIDFAFLFLFLSLFVIRLLAEY